MCDIFHFFTKSVNLNKYIELNTIFIGFLINYNTSIKLVRLLDAKISAFIYLPGNNKHTENKMDIKMYVVHCLVMTTRIRS